MRERNLLHLFLALNVALAAAFIVYLFLSNNRQPEIVSTSFATTKKAHPASNAMPLAAVATPSETKTNAPVTAPPVETKSAPPTGATQPELKPVFTGKKFNWEQVESQDYLKYIDSLRAVGCPEEKVHSIILADINDLFAKKRIKEAVAHDTEWWHTDSDLMMVAALQEKGRELEQHRRSLITRLLGSEALENEDEKGESLLWSTVQLTGPVLGSLSPELHNRVQEICGRAKERGVSLTLGHDIAGQPQNPVELAKMREQTRADLKQALSSQELEEFLLRYSYNALQLRSELRGLEPTADEFRKIFRALDPIDHQMQLEYGTKDALSEKQRERYERQRDDLTREALGPERFAAYILTKDPLYRQAQMFATQYGAPPKAVLPIYQMTKANEGKRQKVMNDPALTPQQKSDAINAIYREQQQSIQQIASEANLKR